MIGACQASAPAGSTTCPASVERDGYAIVDSPTLVDRTRAAMYAVADQIRAAVGPERLARSGELGVLRLMVAYDDHFRRLLELEPVMAVVDRARAPNAILHLRTA